MRRLLAMACALIAAPAAAQLAPPQRVAAPGTVELATSAELAPLLGRLAEVFTASHPGVQIVVRPIGSNVAMAALYSAKADMAIIGRAASDQEAKAFEWIYRRPPAALPLFTGSADRPGHSPDIAVIVARSSPLQSIPVGAVAARLLPGGTGHVIMPDSESGTGRFVRHALLADANQLDWDRITEVAETDHHHPEAVADRIAALVARDPQAIGLADARPRKGVRRIAVSGGEALLDRRIFAYASVNLPPEARQFIAFIRSEAARPIIAASPYRPLTNPPPAAP